MINNKKGVTLIEIIISLAILGIIVVSLLAMFSTGFTFIARAGQRSEATFDNITQVEDVLKERNSTTSDDIPIVFSDSSTIDAEGSEESEVVPFTGSEVEFFYFHPKY